MTRLESLRNQVNDLIEERDQTRSSILGLAERETPLEGEDATNYMQLNERFEQIDPQIEQLRTQIAQLDRVLNAPEQAREVASPTFARQQPNPLDDEMVQYGPIEQVRGAARTAIERLSRADDHVREEMTRTLERADDPSGALSRHIIAASRDTYRAAFSKLISGRSWSMTPEEQRSVEHVRAASLTDAAGGYAVPTVLDPTIILTGTHNGLTPNPVRQLANVVQITGDNYNVVQSAGVTASYAAEAAEATDNAPTLALKTITPFKAHAYVPFTMEIQGDWSQMENELRRLLLVAKDDLEINKFTLGTGTLEPLGIVYDMYTNYTAQTQASATADVFAAADIYALAQKVAVRFRGRGQWMANEITYDLIRAFGVAGKHYFQESIALDRPGTILGRPAYGDPHMDGVINAGAENYMMIFGDIREAYTIVDRVGMSVELNPMGLGTGNNFPNGTRGLYAWWRNGAAIVNSSALATLNVT